MKRIIRRVIQRDLSGRLFSERIEQLTDDDDGMIEEIVASSVAVCQACARPLAKTEEVRGVCVQCRRLTCSECSSQCASCQAPLCPDCRLGFPEKGLSVCEACLRVLLIRQAREDRMLDEKIHFERLMATYAAQMKLSQLGQNDDSITGLLARIAGMRVSRKLAELEKHLSNGQANGRKLLRRPS